MRKRARSVLTGLLVLCCALTGLGLAVHVQADSSGPAGRNIIVTENASLTRTAYSVVVSTQTSTPVESPSSGPWQAAWTWIRKATRSTGTWIQKTSHSTGTWIQKTTRSTGAFIASLSINIRDFFVSGQALKVLQTATQAINDFAVRLFLPLSVLVAPILEHMVSGLSVTPELLAVWLFWVVVVLALIILILALRPRRNVGKRLPRVTPRTAGQGENTIEFGLVEQGPKPSTATSLDQFARTHEKQEMPLLQESAARPAIAEESSHARLDSPSVPEISLEPLGFFGGADTVPAVPEVPADAAATIPPALPPLLEFAASQAELPTTPTEPSEPTTATAELSPAVPADVPSEALLTPPQEGSSIQEAPAETLFQPFPEPELRPLGQEAPVQPVEPESNASDTVTPLAQPLPAEETVPTTQETPDVATTPVAVPVEAVPVEAVPVAAVPVEAVPVEAVPVEAVPVEAVPVEAVPVEAVPVEAVPVEAVPVEAVPVAAVPVEEVPVEEVPVDEVPVEAVPVEAVPVAEVPVDEVPVEAVPVEAVPVEAVPLQAVPVETGYESPTAKPTETNSPAPSSADLLSRLLDDEESFQRTMVAASATAGAAAPVPPSAPAPASRPAPQPSIFSGDVELDTLLHDGVVADAGALAQLFRGGYRSRISKLAISAKDLQNVPEEMRQVLKLTVVALSPIELSIARDLAMRLEAPGFVGEALLVARKMGYENYLTTYKNISKNYKDVSIVETTSLKVPEISAESGGDLISFS